MDGWRRCEPVRGLRGVCLALAWTACACVLLVASSASSATINGTVFEDRNYGGGAGRTLLASGGTVIPNVRVELYTPAGAFSAFVNTGVGGTYSFTVAVAGTYTVRVANRSIVSTRATCLVGTCIPVQTFRTNAAPAAGGVVNVTDRVGGQNPQLLDSVNNTTSATLAALTTATTTPQSITSVQLTSGGAGTVVNGINFGFNFDTIVNVANTGQGSLRQFVVNANALGGEGALAQVGLTAGRESSIFMIPNGVAQPGLHATYANQLTVGGANGGAARITLATALPAITGPSTILDGRTQTTNVRATAGGAETNPGQIGSGGTVGTSSTSLPFFERPEVVINAAATLMSATGAPVGILGVAVENGGISVAGANSLVQNCLAGTQANGTVATAYSGSYGITIGAGANIAIVHNFVRVNNSGIRGDATGANALIEYNEVDSLNGSPGGLQTNTFDGILVINSASNITVRYNLAKNQRGGGLEFGFGSGAVTGTVTENTLTANGFLSAGSPSTEALNVAFYSLAAGTSMTFSNNVVSNSGGTGVVVESASGIVITQNSIFGNGAPTGLGIDLDPRGVDPNGYTPAQGVTLNDPSDVDAGPNGLQNFAVIESALISGGNLTVNGWASPGSLIEFFLSSADPSGFGEGQTYLFSATEGTGDADATASAYGPGAINGVVQGSDNTNRFSFTLPTPGGVSPGVRLTSTARLAGNTSEFSAFVVVANAPVYAVAKTSTAISDPVNCATPGNSASCNPLGSQRRVPGAVVEYLVSISNSGGAADADSVRVSDPVPADTTLRVVDLGGAGSGPVAFSDGATSSALTYTFTSLGSATDDLEFSSDGGTTWTYTPAADSEGCDPAVTDVRINPKGTFAADTGTPDPSFSLRFRVCVE